MSIQSIPLSDFEGLFRIEQLGEEYFRRRDEEGITIDTFVAEHPSCSSKLRNFLEALEAINNVKPEKIESKTRSFPEIRDYKIHKEIGRGGMGVVYEAEQISLSRRVALKTIRFGNESLVGRQRFQHEARTAAKLHHNHIVPVYEIGEDDGTYFYAMQFIDGCGLDRVVAEARNLLSAKQKVDVVSNEQHLAVTMVTGATFQDEVTEAWNATSHFKNLSGFETELTNTKIANSDFQKLESPSKDTLANALADKSTSSNSSGFRHYCKSVASVGVQVADALQCAHSEGVFHRDIKPANLLMDNKGDVWVADFGLVKTENTELTQTGDFVGTLRYMSPERFDGVCDARSDIYSLGLTLYEMLALQPAFGSTGQLSLLEKIRSSDPKPLREINPRVPFDLQTIVEKAIEKDPKRRYPSASAMQEDLERFLSGLPILARRVSTAERLLIWSKRNPVVAALLNILLLGTVLTIIGLTYATFSFRTLAQKNRNLAAKAIDSKTAAEESAERATKMSGLLEQNLYYAEMKLAYDAVQSPNGVKNARRMLNRWSPGKAQNDLRGWEWYLIDSIANPISTVIDTKYYGPCFGVDWTSDGKNLCWSSGSGVYVADFPRFDKRAKMLQHTGFVFQTRFSPGGEFVASASRDRTVKIWDWRKDQIVKQFSFDSPAGAMAWSVDGDLYAVQVFDRGGDPPGKLMVYDTENWEVVQQFDQVDGNDIYEISFDKSGKRIVAFSKRTTKIVDVESGKTLREKQLHNDVVVGYDWHPSKEIIASVSRDGTTQLWNLTDDSVKVVNRAQEQAGVHWHPDGKRLAFGNWDYGVRFTDPFSSGNTRTLFGHKEWIHSVRWHPNQPYLASSASDGTIRIWDLNLPPASKTILPESKRETLHNEIVWSNDGQRLAISANEIVEVRDVSNWDVLRSDRDYRYSGGGSINWLHDNSAYLNEAANNILYWTTSDKPQTKVATEGKLIVGNLHPDGNQLVFVETNSRNDIWQLKVLDVLTNEVTELNSKTDGQYQHPPAWSPDGQFIVAYANGYASIFEFATQKFTVTIDWGRKVAQSIVWSRDGKKLAAAGHDQTITIVDTSSWEVVQELKGHNYVINSLDFSPDGSRIASGSRDKTVRLWDVGTGDQTISLKTNSSVTDVAWSPCGKRLGYIGEDGVTKILDATAGFTREYGQIESRNFSDPATEVIFQLPYTNETVESISRKSESAILDQ